MRKLWVLSLWLALIIQVLPAAAQEEVTYHSHPERVAIFLNNVALVEDTMTLPGAASVEVTLPPQAYPDTLILTENGTRVPNYRIAQRDGVSVVRWKSNPAESITATLTYLVNGLSWEPTYDMQIIDNENVQFSYFAEIRNEIMELEEVDVRLVAGRVDTQSAIETVSEASFNQYAAGYEYVDPAAVAPVGAVAIQHVYNPGTITTLPGETLFLQLLNSPLTARRLLIWNASQNQQVSVIYKVQNTTDIPFAEGIVRSYQDGLFIGSDFIEATPVNGEGSVTVGSLADIRVNRDESVTAIPNAETYQDTRHEVKLTISNFTAEAVEMEVLDIWNQYGQEFQFSMEPERDTNNILRWQITVPAGETLEITYEYVTD